MTTVDGRRAWAVLVALCLGQSLVLLNSTVVNVAVPDLAADLGASLDGVLWVVNSYVVVVTGLLLVTARLGDLVGPKRMYLAGVAVFTAASALCGLASSPGQLVAARVAQGVGAAMLSPQSLAMISHLFPPRRRGAAFGVWGAFAGISVAIAPTVGGLLVSWLDWRWVFLVNVPVGVCVLVAAAIVVPAVRVAGGRRLDLAGALLVTAALFLVSFALIEGEPRGWGSVWGPVTVPVLLGVGVLALVGFALVQRSRQDRDPLVPFAVVRDRDFVLMSGVSAAIACGVGGTLFLVLLHLQTAAGMSALAAGLVVAVAPAVSALASPLAGRLTDRLDGRWVLAAGLACTALGAGYLAAVLSPDARWPVLVPPLLVFGFGMGVVFSPAGVIATRGVPPELAGAASGLFNLARMSGTAVGGAAVGALLQARLGRPGEDLAAIPPDVLGEAVREVFALPVLVLVAGIALTAAARPSPAGDPGPDPGAIPARAGGTATR